MKRLFVLAGIVGFCSCNNKVEFKKAEDAEDAGREFIRASLDGNYEKAKFYLYKDSADFNLRVLDKWKKSYDALKGEEKSAYQSSSIRPIVIEPSADSSSYSYTYYNSFKKDTTTIRILKSNDEWLVDLRALH